MLHSGSGLNDQVGTAAWPNRVLMWLRVAAASQAILQSREQQREAQQQAEQSAAEAAAALAAARADAAAALAAAEAAAVQRLVSQEQAVQLSCQAALSEARAQLQQQAAQKQQLLFSLQSALSGALPDHLHSGGAQAGSSSAARADNTVEILLQGERCMMNVSGLSRSLPRLGRPWPGDAGL
jgi:hypothetical protein